MNLTEICKSYFIGLLVGVLVYKFFGEKEEVDHNNQNMHTTHNTHMWQITSWKINGMVAEGSLFWSACSNSVRGTPFRAFSVNKKENQ